MAFQSKDSIYINCKAARGYFNTEEGHNCLRIYENKVRNARNRIGYRIVTLYYRIE